MIKSPVSQRAAGSSGNEAPTKPGAASLFWPGLGYHICLEILPAYASDGQSIEGSRGLFESEDSEVSGHLAVESRQTLGSRPKPALLPTAPLFSAKSWLPLEPIEVAAGDRKGAQAQSLRNVSASEARDAR